MRLWNEYDQQFKSSMLTLEQFLDQVEAFTGSTSEAHRIHDSGATVPGVLSTSRNTPSVQSVVREPKYW